MQQPVQQRPARFLQSRLSLRATKTRRGTRRYRCDGRNAGDEDDGDDGGDASDGAAPQTAKICAAILRETKKKAVLLQTVGADSEVGGDVAELAVRKEARLQGELLRAVAERGSRFRRVQLGVLVEEVKNGENRGNARRDLGGGGLCGEEEEEKESTG